MMNAAVGLGPWLHFMLLLSVMMVSRQEHTKGFLDLGLFLMLGEQLQVGGTAIGLGPNVYTHCSPLL